MGRIRIQAGNEVNEDGFDCEHASQAEPPETRPALEIGGGHTPVEEGRTALVRLHQARVARTDWAKVLKVPERIEAKSVGATLVLVPPGEFQMGNEKSVDALVQEFPYMKKEWLEDAARRHRVRNTQPFYVAEPEVTNGAFEKFGKVLPADMLSATAMSGARIGFLRHHWPASTRPSRCGWMLCCTAAAVRQAWAICSFWRPMTWWQR